MDYHDWDLALCRIREAGACEAPGLSLAGLRLERLPENIRELRLLQHLDLSDCAALTDVQGLAGLTGLQWLNLRRCRALTDVQGLAGLTELRELNLSWCFALTDVEVLAGLTELRELDLSWCLALTDVEVLAGLTELRELDLSLCRALTHVQVLRGLTELRRLNLRSCRALTNVQGLAGLTRLQWLDLSFCKALTDLQGLAGLTGLQRLYLRGCLLECAPERCPLPTSSSLAFVCADRLRSAPAELGSSSDDDNALPRIRAWQQDLGAGEAASSTLKLFILGNGGVGKTQISRRLHGETFDPSVPSTHGIQQFSVRLFDGTEEEPAVDAHVWDFGGQDVYLGTHALFVDRHAIFVLCWNPEYENTKDFTQHGTVMRNRPLAYWLAYIESLASSDTPVLLVQTQCDRQDDVRAVPYNGTHGLKRVKALACSAKCPDGMEELGLALKVTVRHQLEAQGKVRLPQSWVGLVSSLEGARARSISRARFDTQCTKHGIQASPALVLEYLHRSGRVFWRKWLFSNHVVLDQSWALEGAYAILERSAVMPLIRQQGGRFSPRLLAALAWRKHSRDERAHFLRLMEECRICFKIDDSTYVAPALLPSREAVERDIYWLWRGARANVVVRLDFVFLHEGVLHAMLCGLGERAGWCAVYWAYGACFYETHYESKVTLSSSLPEPHAGKGGWIRIEVAGGKAAELAEYLKESILRVNIGRKPEVEWELGSPDSVVRKARTMDQDTKTPPFKGLMC